MSQNPPEIRSPLKLERLICGIILFHDATCEYLHSKNSHITDAENRTPLTLFFPFLISVDFPYIRLLFLGILSTMSHYQFSDTLFDLT